jgi:hypothetical protein
MSENPNTLKNIWKNRMVGEGERPAKEFILNALNWRTHPDLQREAINAILGEIGWVQRVLVNRTTGNVLDGHLRVEEALKQGEDTLVPYVEVELTEDEERKVLALFDRISAMAGKNVEKYEELVASVDFDSPVLDAILKDMTGEMVNIEDFYQEVPPSENPEFVIEIFFSDESEFREAKDALRKIDKSPKKAVQKLLSL